MDEKFDIFVYLGQ